MTRSVKLSILTGALVLVTACAHAAPSTSNLCPAGTKTAALIQDSGIPGIPISMPPDVGAYGETSVQQWDISNSTEPFQVQCNPNTEGFKGQTVHNVPANSKSCQFDSNSGNFTCSQ